MAQATGKKRPWGIVNGFQIPADDGSIYLTRWGVRTPFGGVYIHRMTGPDERQVPHDHPWPFVSLIVKGGYDELRINKHDTHAPLKLRRRRTWHFNVMRRDDAHFIRDLHSNPTWTVVLFGKRRRTWGFWFIEEAEGHWRWVEFDKTRFEQERLERVANGFPANAKDGDLLIAQDGANIHVRLGSSDTGWKPWSDPSSDPIGDVNRHLQMVRNDPIIKPLPGAPGRCECGVVVLGPIGRYEYGGTIHTPAGCGPV